MMQDVASDVSADRKNMQLIRDTKVVRSIEMRLDDLERQVSMIPLLRKRIQD